MSDEETRQFSEGVNLFNRRRFFDAHDVWEELWMETRGKRRLLYQGLIQAAVAYYHALNANNSGASNLMRRAVRKLESFTSQESGISLEAMLPTLRRHAETFHAHMFEERVVIDEQDIPTMDQITHIE